MVSLARVTVKKTAPDYEKGKKIIYSVLVL